MKKKRPLGQNFLVDQNSALRIVESANIGPGDRVVEIGPGRGELTEGLLARAEDVTALEIDSRLCGKLAKRFAGRPGFHLLHADALTYDYSALGSRLKIVSNLPYYAATPILKRLIHYGSRIDDMILMLQKEVVDRLTANPNCKEYGSLTVFVQYHCDVERLFEVDRASFAPPPKVDSSVIRVTPLERPRVEVQSERTFHKVVNAAFFHKRKMLKNNLTPWKDQFRSGHDKIELAGIDLTRRGETLTLGEFAALSNFIHSQYG